MRKICLIIILSLCAIMVMADKTRIAVYVDGVIDDGYKTLLGDNLAEGFIQSGQYIAVNRSEYVDAALLKARARQENGKVDVEQIVNSTKEFGESELFVVNVMRIENMYNFRAQLVDMESNALKGSVSAPLPVDSLNLSSILLISKKLLSRFVETTTNDEEIAGVREQERRSNERSIALKRYEAAQDEFDKARRERNISYDTFRAKPEKYTRNDEGSNYYYEKGVKTTKVGHWLWFTPAYTALGVGMGIGLADLGKLNNMKAPIAIGAIVGSMLPTFCCYIAGAAYKKKAWRIYTKPYHDAEKELKEAREQYLGVSLQVAPVSGYDWAGVQIRINL